VPQRQTPSGGWGAAEVLAALVSPLVLGAAQRWRGPLLDIAARRGAARPAPRVAAAGLHLVKPRDPTAKEVRRFLRTQNRRSPDDPLLVSQVRNFISNYPNAVVFVTVVQARYPFATDEFLARHFLVTKHGSPTHSDVRLPPTPQQLDREMNEVAEKVVRYLFKVGGSADLHTVCGKFRVPAMRLLSSANGKTFDIHKGQVRLAGNLFKVAQTAACTKATGLHVGRRKSRTDLLTTQGESVDDALSRRLLLRVEGLIASAGNGRLPDSAVYSALGLKPDHSLKRWIKRVGVERTAEGHFRISDHRMKYFRVRRAMAIAMLLEEEGGTVPLPMALQRIHRPPELAAIEHQERQLREAPRCLSPLRPPGGGYGNETVDAFHKGHLRSPDFSVAERGLPLLAERSGGGGHGESAMCESDLDEEADDMEMFERVRNFQEWQQQEGIPHEFSLAVISPPNWVERWLGEFFEIDREASTVTFEPNRVLWDRTKERAHPKHIELTEDEEVARVMEIEEEMRLRYGRAHLSIFSGPWPGLRRHWLSRFYDITVHGYVIIKSEERQTFEAIAICRRIAAASVGPYTVVDAFRDYGVGRQWLKQYFTIGEGDILGVDPDPLRAWDPPPEDRGPNPHSYKKLDAPRLLHTKHSKYNRRKYRKGAGGLVY